MSKYSERLHARCIKEIMDPETHKQVRMWQSGAAFEEIAQILDEIQEELRNQVSFD